LSGAGAPWERLLADVHWACIRITLRRNEASHAFTRCPAYAGLSCPRVPARHIGHFTCNEGVGGSSPPAGSFIKKAPLRRGGARALDTRPLPRGSERLKHQPFQRARHRAAIDAKEDHHAVASGDVFRRRVAIIGNLRRQGAAEPPYRNRLFENFKVLAEPIISPVGGLDAGLPFNAVGDTPLFRRLQ
jgi:hypothetical protein